ncbi:MAG: TolC family protein [Isosphaeraceae bacterium]|nr:TolC family protein [Isosphaeraceae bacterium]
MRIRIDIQARFVVSLLLAWPSVAPAQSPMPAPTPPPNLASDSEPARMPGLPPALPPRESASNTRSSDASLPTTETVDPSKVGGVSLSGLIGTALRANPDLVSASERIQIADATLRRARAEFYPKLSLTEAFVSTNIAGLAFFLEANQRRLSLNQDFNHPGFVSNFSTLATLQQNIYAGGKRTAETLSAEEQRRAASFALGAVRNELVFRVAEAYYRVVQAGELLKGRSESVRSIERQVELVRSRLDNGTAVRSDLLSVEVELAEAREAMITANNQLELTWAILENVVGCSVPHVLPSQAEPAPWTARTDAVESAIAEALARRPELGASLSEVRGATHQVEAARAGKRPTVDFFGNFSTFDINPESGGNGLIVGLIASINVFDGHRTKSQVSAASARVRELQARHQRLLMDIELDVRRAYLALQDADGRLLVSAQTIEQADQSLREIEDRYNDAKATITQLIDARVAATNARVRRASAAADLEIARAGLERVLGRLNGLLAP